MSILFFWTCFFWKGLKRIKAKRPIYTRNAHFSYPDVLLIPFRILIPISFSIMPKHILKNTLKPAFSKIFFDMFQIDIGINSAKDARIFVICKEAGLRRTKGTPWFCWRSISQKSRCSTILQRLFQIPPSLLRWG